MKHITDEILSTIAATQHAVSTDRLSLTTIIITFSGLERDPFKKMKCALAGVAQLVGALSCN